ncbi:MAG TPA: translation elongation factor Ts [Candidatus Bipolaricaulota bacterium]
MDITMELVKQLRNATGIGIMDCKAALQQTKGDMEAAKKLLREQGKEIIAEARAASEGCVGSYLHHSGTIGVLLEVNCNTDFTAKNEDFRRFVNDVALQIASEKALYVKAEDVPADVLESEKGIYFKQAQAEGKPEKIAAKIVEGRIKKFYDQVCLLQQQFVRNPDVTIEDLRNELAAKTGENIVIKRFARFEVGKA